MPTPTQGTINRRYTSAIDPILDARSIKKEIIDIQKDRSFMSLLTDLGGKVVWTPPMDSVNNAIFYSWQNSPLSQLISTTGATVTGNGTSGTPLSVTGLPAGSQNVLIPGILLACPQGGVVRVTTVPSTSSFTALSVTGTSVTVTAGDWLSAISNAQESGSDAPLAQRWDVSRLTNVTQVIRNTIKTTDVDMQNGIEFTIDGVDRILPYEAIRLKDLHDLHTNGALFLGKQSATRFTDSSPALSGANGNGIQTTRGLDEYITTYGITDQTATLGTLAITDVADAINQLVANRSTQDYLIGAGQSVYMKFSDMLKNMPSSGAVNSVRINVQGKEVDLDVESFNYGGFRFNLHSLGLLNNQQIVGSAATSLHMAAKCAYFMPLGQAKTLKNGVSPFMRYRYQPQPTTGGENRTINGATEETRYGGLAPNPTSGSRTLEMTMTSNIGLEIFNPQSFLRMQVLS